MPRLHLFRCCIAYILGIIIAVEFPLFHSIELSVICAVFSVTMYFIGSMGEKWGHISLVVAFTFGFVYTNVYYRSNVENFEPFMDRDVVVYLTIDEVPSDTRSGQSVNVKVHRIDNTLIEGRMLLSFGFDRIQYNEVYKMTGRISPSKGVKYTSMVKPSPKGNFYTFKPTTIELIAPSRDDLSIRAFAYRARQHIQRVLNRHFSVEEAALVSGLLTGDTGNMPKSLTEAFSHCGLMHIVAFSGMHVGMWLMMYNLLAFYIGLRPRWYSKLFIILSLIFMLFITGGPYSAMRSIIMTLVSMSSLMLLRDVDDRTSLAIAVLIITLINPTAMYDKGFQLSASATLGIFLFREPFFNATKWSRNGLTSALLTSLAATLTTAPLTLGYFGIFPLFALLSQFIVMPLLPLITALSALFVVVPNVFLAAIISAFANIIIYTIEIFSRVPLASLQFKDIPPIFYIVYSLCLMILYNLVKGYKYDVHRNNTPKSKTIPRY